MFFPRFFFVAALAAAPLMAQYPEDSQADLYFPHLADGGSSGQRWQSRFTFTNPSTSSTAYATLYTVTDTQWAPH